MKESEWWSTDDPVAMLFCVEAAASGRKLRLFACACCRRVWNEFVPPLVVGAVELAEAFADGGVGESVLARVRGVVTEHAAAAARSSGQGYLSYGYPAHVGRAAAAAAAPVPREAAHRAGVSAAHAANDSSPWDTLPRSYSDPEFVLERAAHADLLRDIFGNPFRPVRIKPAWLTSDVLALARGIYADLAFDRMPILADALQDAGCDHDEVLAHCREAREHARGCWLVDALLGKS
jgi:hypothetical protein